MMVVSMLMESVLLLPVLLTFFVPLRVRCNEFTFLNVVWTIGGKMS